MSVLSWEDINYVVQTKDANGRKSSNRTILCSTSAHAQSGRVLAILGPSGCGKTSLLNALSKRVAVKRGDTLSGNVFFNGELLDGSLSGVSLSYVEQEPKFFSNLTVRETLELDTKLRGEDDSTARDVGGENFEENVSSELRGHRRRRRYWG
jgi:ABC-type multidrug transport system ATPase subunit